jgi:hypothetical protein
MREPWVEVVWCLLWPLSYPPLEGSRRAELARGSIARSASGVG